MEIEEACLALGGRPLKYYGLPQPNRSQFLDSELGEYQREINYDKSTLERFVVTNEISLTNEQKSVYNEIIFSIDKKEGRWKVAEQLILL